MRLLVASILDTSITIGLGLAAASLLRHRSAALRHCVLAATVVCAAATPALEWLLPAWVLPVPSSVLTDSDALIVMSPAHPLTAEPGIALSSAAPAVMPMARWDVAADVLWVSGALIGLLVLISGGVRLRRLVNRAEIIRDAKWNEIASEVAAAHGLRRRLHLLYSEHPTPVTWGVWRPRVLLPSTAKNWSEDRMRIVLYHEWAHVRRGDWGIQLAASLLCCCYWFNPLIWMAARRLRHESERACDDLVLESGVAGTDYATHLVAMAREAGEHRTVWSPATAIAQSSTLEERIRAMLNTGLNRKPLTMIARILTAVAVIVATLPIAAASASSRTRQASASIAGVLYDQHSGLLPDVEISLTEDASGLARTARSDQAGSFSFRDLPPGDYTLVTSLPGFAPVRNLIRVGPGGSVRRNIVLPLGTLQETIRVVSDGTAARVTRSSAHATRQIPEPRLPSPCVGASRVSARPQSQLRGRRRREPGLSLRGTRRCPHDRWRSRYAIAPAAIEGARPHGRHVRAGDGGGVSRRLPQQVSRSPGAAPGQR